MDEILFTYSEVSRRCDIRRETVSDLVRKLGISARRHPVNGNSLAINAAGLRRIERALALAGPATVGG